MFRLKNCPHCGGDIMDDRDQYGWFEVCLQCGHMRYLSAPESIMPATVEKLLPAFDQPVSQIKLLELAR